MQRLQIIGYQFWSRPKQFTPPYLHISAYPMKKYERLLEFPSIITQMQNAQSNPNSPDSPFLLHFSFLPFKLLGLHIFSPCFLHLLLDVPIFSLCFPQVFQIGLLKFPMFSQFVGFPHHFPSVFSRFLPCSVSFRPPWPWPFQEEAKVESRAAEEVIRKAREKRKAEAEARREIQKLIRLVISLVVWNISYAMVKQKVIGITLW